MSDSEGGTVLKIEYQRDIDARNAAAAAAAAASRQAQTDSSDSEPPQPFPIPQQSIDPNVNLITEKRDPWRQVKKEIIEQEPKSNESSNWPSILKVLRSTKHFFGIDQTDEGRGTNTSQQQQNSNDEQGGSPSSSTERKRNSPIYQNQALTNWNERTFRVLQSNAVFGGKLKNAALSKYIENLDESALLQPPDDESEAPTAGMFQFYKATGGASLRLNKRTGLTDIAFDEMKKALIKKKSSPSSSKTEPSLIQQRTPEYEFEESLPREGGMQSRMAGPQSASNRQVQFDYPDSRQQPAAVGRRLESPQIEEVDNIEGPCDAFMYAFGTQRVFGMGFCGRLCDNDLDQTKKDEFEDLIKSVKQHRSYFTYWVTFVQIVVCLVSLFAYGLAPVGFSYTTKRGLATGINLEKQLISYPVKQNFWIGPVWTDLVHLGAKYAPCMRNDTNIWRAIEHDRLKEMETACCIRNDKGGCVQTSRDKCSELFSRFVKWNASSYVPSTPNGLKRSSGSVCGLDPEYCNDLESHKWPDDITHWPICEKPTAVFTGNAQKDEHMYCEIIGRPCCVGIQGECVITTLEHCNLMRGYFHQNAHLCSQVDCMQDVCGMIDFLNVKNPDQVYRLFTSIFIHAGIIQLLITIFFQIFILRDVEKLAGCLRVAIIYIGSGVIGNLGSAIFLPYQAEVGPMGSQFGIIACLFVEMFHAWEMYQNPCFVLFKLLACLFVLILIGFLPMIDNFANMFGFLSGLLLSSILFPNINLYGRCRRILVISVCISVVIVSISALVVFFYIHPIEKCDICKLLSCPFGNTYCLDMDFNVTRLN